MLLDLKRIFKQPEVGEGARVQQYSKIVSEYNFVPQFFLLEQKVLFVRTWGPKSNQTA